ncbi:MAG: MscL family protein, partial [Ruminiclostridium sp.]|nr:MscL family protein [Ruminiclostridium sp.]
PALGLITVKMVFGYLKVVLYPEELYEAVEFLTEELAIRYGLFIDAIVSFLLIAAAVFAVVKIAGTIRDKAEARKKAEEEAAPAPEPAPDPQLVLLTEIRDLLKKE